MTANRCERIRAWLATQDIPASARDVLLAIEPRGDINLISASLSAMEKTGLVEGGKVGTRRYYVIGRAPKARAGVTRKPINGRADRVRTWLRDHDRGFTPAELRAALDPAASSTQVAASLATLAAQGHIFRAAEARLTCYARTQVLADRQLAEEVARRDAAKPAPPPKPERPPKNAKAAAAPRRRAKATPKPAKQRPPAAPPARPVPRGLPPPPSRASARTTPRGRPAPVSCSLDSISERQRQASDRIAADIAAFEAKGGRIQRLGPTQFFTRIGMEAANHVPPRAPRTGTTDLDD